MKNERNMLLCFQASYKMFMNKNTDKNEGMVSVIIPVYNCEKTIDESIRSIKDQIYENWEVIIIDDGSTDGTFKKIEAWVNSDLRINVIRQENQGAGPARNKGMEKAVGEYIAFLDGDDFWQNNYALKKIMDAVKGNSYDIIGTFSCYYKDEEFIKIPRHRKYFTLESESGKWIDFRDEQDCYGYCSYLFRRKFLTENNIVFPPYRRFQDPPFLTKALVKAKQYYVLPIEWHSCRHRYDNVLFTEQRINDYLKGILDVTKIAQCQHMGKLIKDITGSINSHRGVIIKSILQGNVEALQCIAELQKYIKNESIEILPLQFIRHSLKNECERIVSRFIQEINKCSKLIIYGSGSYGHKFFTNISRYNIQPEILFAQTDKPRNKMICERPCYCLNELRVYNEDAMVVVTVQTEEMQNEMISNLKEMGFKKYQQYTDDLIIALECANR